MELAPNDARALAAIVCMYADATPEERQLAEETMRRSATFTEGDDVRWHESPNDPINRGEVEEVLILGFPEQIGRPTIAYDVLFRGPEGVGFENHIVRENELRYFGD